MRILRRKRTVELFPLALAFTSWVAMSTCLHAQHDLVHASLPSYYAGHTASIRIAETANTNAAALPPTAAVHVAVVATSPNPGVPAQAVDSPMTRAQNSNTRLPHRGIETTLHRPQGAAQIAQSGLPAIGRVAPAARDSVGKSDVRRESGSESGSESGRGRGEAERDSAKNTDAERRATLREDSTNREKFGIEWTD